MELQKQMLGALTGIFERLQSIEKQLKVVPATTKPPPGLARDKRKLYDSLGFVDLEKRIDSMEMLLFRMSFEEYEKFDKLVAMVTHSVNNRPAQAAWEPLPDPKIELPRAHDAPAELRHGPVEQGE